MSKPQKLASKTLFTFQRVMSPHKLQYTATTSCIVCGQPMTVEYGATMATFIVGAEMVGICCAGCLTPESRARLLELRDARREVSR